MDKLKTGVQTFDKVVGNFLDKYVKTPTFVRGVVHLLLMLYVARIAPSPPKAVLDLFENVYFRLFVFSMVLWTAQFSPSTSILITLAFLVTVNYTTTGKVWELLENTEEQPAVIVPVTPEDSAKAVEVLAEAASNSQALSPEQVAPVANIAMANAKTEDGLEAIKLLAEQAVVPEAGEAVKVEEAAQKAVESIVVPPAPTPSEAPAAPTAPASMQATPEESAKAIVALVEAAASSEAMPPQEVLPVANIAMANATTPEGAEAIKKLAEQAIAPEAGEPAKLQEAALAAVQSIAEPAPAAAPAAPAAAKLEGCYPMRRYDMSKVQPQIAGELTAEDYQPFVMSQ